MALGWSEIRSRATTFYRKLRTEQKYFIASFEKTSDKKQGTTANDTPKFKPS